MISRDVTKLVPRASHWVKRVLKVYPRKKNVMAISDTSAFHGIANLVRGVMLKK